MIIFFIFVAYKNTKTLKHLEIMFELKYWKEDKLIETSHNTAESAKAELESNGVDLTKDYYSCVTIKNAGTHPNFPSWTRVIVRF